MKNIEAALSYASMGWHVFPCHYIRGTDCSCGKQATAKRHTVGKHPATMDGFKSATVDENIIRNWWTFDPSYNIGISTGHSKLIVLDVDPKSGGAESLDSLISEHGNGFMDTVRCKTGSGGLHLYFKDSFGLKSSAGEIADGLDIRAVDGYVLAPCSNHVSGGKYEWVEGHGNESTMLDVPSWLASKIMEARPINGPAPPIPSRVTRGKRNSTLLSVAGSLHRRNVPRRAIVACLAAMNEDAFDPPVPLSDIEYVVSCVLRYSVAQPVKKVEPADKTWWWGNKW